MIGGAVEGYWKAGRVPTRAWSQGWFTVDLRICRRIRGFAGWRGVWCPAVSGGEVERRAMGVVEAEVVLGQWGSDTLKSKATGTNGSSNAPFEQGEGLRQETLSGAALHPSWG